MEDSGTRQLPGNVRAADRWSVGIAGLSGVCEGWGIPGCQQAVALCRVDRAQPTGRASGVSCTPWFGSKRDSFLIKNIYVTYLTLRAHLNIRYVTFQRSLKTPLSNLLYPQSVSGRYSNTSIPWNGAPEPADKTLENRQSIGNRCALNIQMRS